TWLAVLDAVGVRVNETLAEEVEWKTCSEIARLTQKFETCLFFAPNSPLDDPNP
ncbi:hypothetical protein HYR99_20830, partial [Candidatus Poribacteria bacterium]|nr:hypothetical protein [Candidatus Poribacteria bacterium]